MFEITDRELKRCSFEKAYNEGYLMFLNNIFPKEYIKKVEGKSNAIIYYGRFIENNKPMSVFVEVSASDKISNYYCSCPEVGHYVGGMCKHLIAFAFSIIKYFQNFENVSINNEDLKKIEEKIRLEEEARKIRAIEFKKKILIEENKKKFQELLNSYNDNKQEIYLKDKIRLVPALYSNRTLGFRIGTNKLYIVKSIKDLIDNVNEERVFSYGKKLTFKHSLENFDLVSQKMLKLLIISSRINGFYHDYREIPLNPLLIDEIMDIYKGNNILIMFEKETDYSEYYVNNLNFDFKLKLNDKGILSITNIGKKAKLLLGQRDTYLVSNYATYKVKENNKALEPLINHLLEYNSIDVMDVLDGFLVYLYPRIYEYIEVDDGFKTNHPLNILRVDSYFDIEGGIVSLDYKYYIDSLEVSENELMNFRYNSYKLDDYFSTIKELGFEEVQVSENDVKYFINSTQGVVEFLRSDLSILNAFGEVYCSETLKRTTVNKVSKGKVNVRYDVDMLSVVFEDFGYTDEELYKLLNGYKMKKKFVRLSKDRIIEVDEESLKEINEVVEELNLDSKHLVSGNKIPIYQSMKTFVDNEFFEYVIDKDISSLVEEISNYKKKTFDVPEAVRENLRPYQLEAFNWLKILTKHKFGGVLADDMGLGKTLEMISLIASDEIEKPSLVVCPKSLTFNWQNEIKKWNESLECQVIYGSAFERIEIIENIVPNVKKIYMTSYDSLRNDIELYSKCDFRFIILDEGQFIKNSEALKTKAVKSLTGEVRFVLTGTPIENSLGDLWSIFDFIMPGYLSNYKRFKEKYETRIVLENDSEMLNVLVKKITPFVLRRTKEEVLKELPEKFETVHYAFMQDYQKRTYQSYLFKAREEMKGEASKIAILSTLTRLRQLCVDPSMFIDNYEGESAKLSLTIEIIKEQIKDNHRMLLFSQFKSAFKNIINELEKNKIKYFVLTGDTSNEDRIRLVEEFNRDEEIKVFLISLKAGGTGLNLVGADTVIHLDPWWNVSAQNQATDRAHRIGQKKTVNVIKLICADSIEQKVLELQNRKKDLVEQVITQNDEKIVKLDNDDIKYLLS